MGGNGNGLGGSGGRTPLGWSGPRWVLPIAFVVIALGGGLGWILQAGRSGTSFAVGSPAMETTLRCSKPTPGCTGDRADRLVTRRATVLDRGQIVVFELPDVSATRCGVQGLVVRRVAGLPGQHVQQAFGGELLVDGVAYPPPSPPPPGRPPDQHQGEWTVPSNTVFVVGDDRAYSCDSRDFGSVPLDHVRRQVVALVRDGQRYPLS
jgi:signal peptidase I